MRELFSCPVNIGPEGSSKAVSVSARVPKSVSHHHLLYRPSDRCDGPTPSPPTRFNLYLAYTGSILLTHPSLSTILAATASHPSALLHRTRAPPTTPHPTPIPPLSHDEYLPLYRAFATLMVVVDLDTCRSLCDTLARPLLEAMG